LTKLPLLALALLAPISALRAAPAYQPAIDSVSPSYRHQAICLYGTGGPYDVEQWEVKFLQGDGKIRIVKVHDHRVEASFVQDAPSGCTGRDFDPAQIPVGVNTALKTARDYARDNHIEFDHVSVFLARPDEQRAPAWRVQLIHGSESRGFVYTNAINGSLAHFQPQAEHGKVDKGFDEVESTFLGVGGDMEEFFTGHRSVDH